MEPLFSPDDGKMQVAALMSGSGSNVRKLLEFERGMEDCPYEIAIIMSDKAKSNAPLIGRDFNVPVFIHDIDGFYKEKDLPKKDLSVRGEFEEEFRDIVHQYRIDAMVLGGYMSVLSELHKQAPTINVHPADLRIKNEAGGRKYTGDNAVYDAIMAGEQEIRSSTHLVTDQVDGGPLLMVSRPVKTHAHLVKNMDEHERKQTAGDFQNRLKEVGDWEILPSTLYNIARGKYDIDSAGELYFQGQPIPQGVEMVEGRTSESIKL